MGLNHLGTECSSPFCFLVLHFCHSCVPALEDRCYESIIHGGVFSFLAGGKARWFSSFFAFGKAETGGFSLKKCRILEWKLCFCIPRTLILHCESLAFAMQKGWYCLAISTLLSCLFWWRNLWFLYISDVQAFIKSLKTADFWCQDIGFAESLLLYSFFMS